MFDRLPERVKIPLRRPFHGARRLLARFWRHLYPDIQVITITGSVGKTTAKEMIAAVLATKYRVVKTEANLDPVFNLPMTLLKLRPGTQKLVLEFAVEYPGEMDLFLSYSKPDIAVVTSLYWTHTQFLKDVAGVAEEKGKMVEAIKPGGWAVLNRDDRRVRQLAQRSRAQTFWYGVISEEASLRAEKVNLSRRGVDFDLVLEAERAKITLPVLGRQMVYAALAAASVGILSGLTLKEIRRGIGKTQYQPNRMRPLPGPQGSFLIDDTYNSNPLGAMAALETLVAVAAPGRAIAVLGEMKELGDYEVTGHRQVGSRAAELGVDQIVTLGPVAALIGDEARSKGTPVKEFSTKKEIADYLKKEIKRADAVLFKASRAVGFEEIVSQLAQS